MFVKIGDFTLNLKVLWNFLQNRRSSENQKPLESRQKCGFLLSLAFYNAPSLDTVDLFPQNCRYRYRLEIWMNSLITVTITVLASAVTPSFPLIPNYHLESHLS